MNKTTTKSFDLNAYVANENEQIKLATRAREKKPTTTMYNNTVHAIGSISEASKEFGQILVQELTALRKDRARTLQLDDITNEVEYQNEFKALVATLA